MSLLSEYTLTDELTLDALKELGFSESYAMPVSNYRKAYDNFVRLKFYHANAFSFNHKSFYCSYRYFPEINYLAISIESMPNDWWRCSPNDIPKFEVNKRFNYIVKHYSDLLVYLTDEWVIEQVKNFNFLTGAKIEYK